MGWIKKWDDLEQKEEILRREIQELPAPVRKAYYDKVTNQLKDPDTYAALNWFFLGGFHHLYLRRYTLFIIEIVLFIVAIAGLLLGQTSAGIIIAALVIYELPQLFFSQQIARQYNYTVSCKVFNHVRRDY